jgi:hypothetical protein
MILVGQDILLRAGRRNASVRKWLAAWAMTVESSDWRSLEDVRRAYPSADGVKMKSQQM